MSTARRVLKNFFSLTSAEIISKVLSLVAVAYLARVLGAEGFGKLGFVNAILAYFMLLVNLGLNTLGAREVARNKEEISKYVNNILTIKLVAFVIAFSSLVIFAYFIPKSLEIKKLILFSGFLLFASVFTIEWVFQGIEKMEFIAISRIARQLAYVGLIFLIIKSPHQLLRIPFINVGAGIVAIFILFSIFLRNFGSIKFDFDFAFWKRILRQSLPMGFSFIMITIYYNFDRIMLGFMKNMEVVGCYSAAYRIILLITTMGTIYFEAIFPVLSRLYKKSVNELRDLVHISFVLMFIVSTLTVILGMVLASEIIKLVYGTQFLESIVVLQILIWNPAIIFISKPFARCLLACDKQKYYMFCITLAGLVNLFMNFVLIPRFSMIGAAVATISAEIVVLVTGYLGAKKILRISLKDLLSFSKSKGIIVKWLSLRKEV